MDTKPIWASKTMWVNALTFLATVTGLLSIDLGLDAETQAMIVTAGLAVANVVLRYVTTKPISG